MASTASTSFIYTPSHVTPELCVYIYIHMHSKEPEVSMIKVRYVNTSMSVCYMFIIQILSLYIIYIHIQYYTTWIIKPVGRGKKCLCLTCCKSFLRHQKKYEPKVNTPHTSKSTGSSSLSP